MKIGITYDLKTDYLKAGFTDEEAGEFDSIDTINAVDNVLLSLGFETERIGNVKQLVPMLAAGRRWDMVFNICEGVYGIGREAQVPALLEAYNIPFTFSDSVVLALSLHKGMTKHVIRDCGIPTADFKVIDHISQIENVNLPYPLFAKPVAEGTGKGVDNASKISNSTDYYNTCNKLLTKFKQPVIIETYLPGREFTVGITGTGSEAQAIGALEVILNDNAEETTYSYLNKEKCEEFVKYVTIDGELADRCMKVAVDSWRALGCRDGGRVDIRLDANDVPNFLEVNPLAGIHPQHSDLPILSTLKNISYIELFRRIMSSALKRYNLTMPKK